CELENAAQQAGANIGAFLNPALFGVPFLIWWWFRGFRAEAAFWPLLVWTALVALIILARIVNP
ncbi:MAG: hypothetical protein AAFP99_11860, partial [Pseudomonadota bacterium]